MTPFEYFVSMVLTLAATITCTLSERMLVRALCILIALFMTYFAGLHGGKLIW